jgi:glycosyltransferase involved in cell wall biosynthesis
MMWNKNEGDILADIISAAVQKVDTLFIADDGSEDASWNVIQAAKNWFDNIEYIQQEPNKFDPAQRQALLNEIRKRYKPEDTWVQIIESDIMILDTDVRKAIEERAVGDVYVDWALINAVIPPDKSWDELDKFPSWGESIKDVMTYGHWIENMTYTFRPYRELWYDTGPWRPWPKGFSSFELTKKPIGDYTPLLAHYGYRGPTHMMRKYGGKTVRKYPSWDFSSREKVLETVYYFNGVWNGGAHPLSREGYKNRKG